MATIAITKPITVKSRTTTVAPVSYTEVEFLSTYDDSKNKKVHCTYSVGGQRTSKLLWEGAAYDAAGDYTEEAAKARLAELLNA